MDNLATQLWEQTLVEGCQIGDHNAFIEIMRIYHVKRALRRQMEEKP